MFSSLKELTLLRWYENEERKAILELLWCCCASLISAPFPPSGKPELSVFAYSLLKSNYIREVGQNSWNHKACLFCCNAVSSVTWVMHWDLGRAAGFCLVFSHNIFWTSVFRKYVAKKKRTFLVLVVFNSFFFHFKYMSFSFPEVKTDWMWDLKSVRLGNE